MSLAKKGKRGTQTNHFGHSQPESAKVKISLANRGENSTHSIVMKEEVKLMRKLRLENKKTWTQMKLAETFDISRRNVRSILEGRSWKHVQ